MNIDPVDPALAGLNPPQRDAVLHEAGPLVVFAGAGSGKTRVITHRVARLVTEHGVAPWNILAVTFTNKAAKEMKARLERLIGGAATRDLWVGTFHATCARLLRRYATEIGIRRDFTIYDESDSRAMVKRLIKELELDDKRFPPKQVTARIARHKQEVQGPDAVQIEHDWDFAFAKLYAAYEERMAACGALDFGDLLYRLVLAIEADEALRTELGRRFKHLLVDEFQDTNHVQYRLVRTIAAQHRNVTVVGDDDQSIYKWRGADRRNILHFRKEFADARVIKLEQNYRSTQRILRAANAVISRASEREPKALWTDNEEGAPITVVTCADERREAALVVEAVRQLRTAGRSLDEIAVFYRIHAQSRLFEEELRKYSVPYRIVGGMRFYDRAEIKDILAYFRVLANPGDDVSLLRIINTPTRGIGKKTIEELLNRAAKDGTGVWSALEKAASGKGGASKRLAGFLSIMGELSMELRAEKPLAAIGYAIYERTGYKSALTDQDSAEADARIQNIEELLGAVQQAQEANPELNLDTFLEQVTLESAGDGDDESEPSLTLMTVHAAKGLEFPVVVVSGLEEDMFPFRRRDDEDDDDAIGEERRLAYVALTRAEDRLMLTWARTRFLFRERKAMLPSRFLAELPREDLQEVVDRDAAARAPSRRANSYGGGGGGYGGGGYGGGGYGGRSGQGQASSARASSARASSARTSGGAASRGADSYVDTSDGSDFDSVRVGMRVRHKSFGLGTIVEIKPSTPPRVAVEFRDSRGSKDVRTIQVSYLAPA